MAYEITKIYTGHVDFNPWCREYRLAVSPFEREGLQDILLTFYASPNVDPWNPSYEFLGGEDYRIYVNEHDVTSALVTELQHHVAAIPPQSLRDSYEAGARAYLRFLHNLDTESKYGQIIAKDEQFIQQYVADPDWPRKFAKLGDRSVGWAGNLHPINFLFAYITVPQLSLQSIWSRFVGSAGKPLPARLADFSPLVITYSQGPAPSFSDVLPSKFIPAGRVVYSCECVYTNPLEPKLREISLRLRSVASYVEGLRTGYLTPIQSDVKVIGDDVRNGNVTVSETLDRLRKVVENIG